MNPPLDDGRGDGPPPPVPPVEPPRNDAEVNANSVYPRIPLPTLIEGAVDAYFLSIEFWFAASGVTNDTRKFNTVHAQVPPTKLQELASIVNAAPAANKYEYIKAALIKHFADSQARRLQRVLSEMPLGDLRPSQLYHNMARVAGNALGETALRDLWAARLPPFTQAAVVAASGTTTEVLATADRVHDSLGLRQNTVANIVPAAPPPSNVSDVARLIQHIDETFRRFRDDLSRERGRSQSRDNPRGRTHNRSQSRNRNQPQRNTAADNDPSGLCWYHAEFGRQAKKCREPCVWIRPSSTRTATPPPPPSSGTN